MRISKTTTAITLGMALALGACGGSETTSEAGEEEATEEAADIEYFVDESGEFAEEVGADAVTNITERLASKHEETGNDIRVLLVENRGENDGGDTDDAAEAARTDMGADALIYIDIGRESIAVVGNNIDERESEGASNAIVTAFDNGNFENGILNGITATEMHMED